MSAETPKPATSTEKAIEMRERRRKAGVVQINFFVREEDKPAIVKAMRDYTDLAWLALYDAGAVLHGANEARAADIRTRLGLVPSLPPSQPENKAP